MSGEDRPFSAGKGIEIEKFLFQFFFFLFD
jgi:hypothetical protein